MIRKLLLFLFLPSILFAQSPLSNPTYAKIIEDECRGALFTEVEILPSLKVSKESFGDTLATELRSKEFPMTTGEVTCKFVVTTQSKILDLTIDSGRVPKQKILKEAVANLAYLWVPARQSSHPVCSYVRLKIKFTDNNVTINISQ